MGKVKAGVGKVNITPPIGVELCGQGVYLGRKSAGIHDELYSKVLVLDNGLERIALVANDLLAVSMDLTESIRVMVEKKAGIKKSNIMVCATHTHNAPAACFMRGWGEIDKDYLSKLPGWISDVAQTAANNLREAKIGFGKGVLPNISRNRVRENGPIDPEVSVMQVIDNSENTIAVLVSFAAHPDIMASTDNKLISTCVPFYAVKMIEENLACPVLYTTGAAGDVGSIYSWGGAEKLEEVGVAIGEKVFNALRDIELIGNINISVRSKLVKLPVVVPDVGNFESILANYETWFDNMMKKRRHLESDRKGWERFYKEWAIEMIEKIKCGADTEISLEVQAVFINDSVLIAIPGELFVELGLSLKNKSPLRNTIIVGYANGYVGYIPTEDEFERGGYAATLVPQILGNFPLAPNVGSILVDEINDLIS